MLVPFREQVLAMHPPDSVWIFVGAKARFPSGVFANVADAEKWIAEHRLTGVLTEYRVGVGAFDQALREGTFEPRDEREKSPEFIGRFSSASQKHYHYEDGARD
ncbi:MAG: hypothetical protein KC933_19030 [Myxococcales bacterium]|nr:hypothetical protein [Myxococcales bacterium]